MGLPSTFQNAVDAVASSGRVAVIGISKSNIADFNFNAIQKKEMAIFGSRNAVEQDFMEVIAMMKKSGLSADAIVTNTYDFADVAQAFEDFSTNGSDMLKVLVKFPE
ncbi:MAG: hypothetical protein LUE17_12425 [Planctomycetaceae bacterium]|nr:hypothetical protein [Planctomycetaceae bacterium]